MNLLFFTVELERNGAGDRPLSGGSGLKSRSQQARFRLIGAAIAMLICTAAAACGGWVLAGGDPAVPDWLALNSDSGMVGAGDRALLEITSQPDRAIVLSMAIRRARHR